MAPRTGMRAHYAKVAKGPKPVGVAQRRVVVKARFVTHGSSRGAPLKAHVAYLARETKGQGKAPDLDPPQRELSRTVDYLAREEGGPARVSFYDGSGIDLDAKAITAVWADDARHFRLIISAEEGAELGDLKPFIRETMAGLERRLGTKLEWVAADHHDTDNPHSHVLIRGRRDDGSDLFIPSRLISSGIREQAQEIVTRALGPRLGVDLARERAREIGTRDLTALDGELLQQARRSRDGLSSPGRADLVARLDTLSGWGLAHPVGGGSWRLDDKLAEKLKAIAVHAQVERAVAATRDAGDPALLLEADRTQPELGRLVHAALFDEFEDTFLAVIETGRGERRYARFESTDDLARLAGAGPGAIVAFEPNVPSVRPSDEAVARIAGFERGFYSAELHARHEPQTSQGLIDANIRRLEALRRSGLVERGKDGVFVLAPDHLERALAYEQRVVQRYPVSARVTSYWTLAEQVQALGPTQLDRVLTHEAVQVHGEGTFARDHAAAVQQRRLFLIEQGWMGKDETAPSRGALVEMASRELRQLAQNLSHELGRRIASEPPDRVSGIYARRIDLAQGRVALILQGDRGVLVPWRPALERFSGREVQGLARGQTHSWGLERSRGIGLPPM